MSFPKRCGSSSNSSRSSSSSSSSSSGETSTFLCSDRKAVIEGPIKGKQERGREGRRKRGREGGPHLE